MMVALIAIVIVAAVALLGTTTSSKFEDPGADRRAQLSHASSVAAVAPRLRGAAWAGDGIG